MAPTLEIIGTNPSGGSLCFPVHVQSDRWDIRRDLRNLIVDNAQTRTCTSQHTLFKIGLNNVFLNLNNEWMKSSHGSSRSVIPDDADDALTLWVSFVTSRLWTTSSEQVVGAQVVDHCLLGNDLGPVRLDQARHQHHGQDPHFHFELVSKDLCDQLCQCPLMSTGELHLSKSGCNFVHLG